MLSDPVSPHGAFIEAVPREHLEGCLLLGYYGGGNFGDELLLELVLRRLRDRDVRDASFIYRSPASYATFHRDYGYTLVDGTRISRVLLALLRARSVVVGGGGLWGLDANRNVLLMSAALYLAREVLDKPVYLLGVGYYGSAGPLGRVAAALVARASSLILARDAESYARFRRLSSRVWCHMDLARSIDDADVRAYQTEALRIGDMVAVPQTGPRAVMIGLRRFRDGRDAGYVRSVERLIAEHPGRPFVLAVLESRAADAAGYAAAVRLGRAHPNASVIDFSWNPFAYLAWLRRHRHRLVVIAPQYHAIVAAHLCGVPLFPLVYDNKVRQLLGQLGHDPGPRLDEVSFEQLRDFVERAEHGEHQQPDSGPDANAEPVLGCAA